MLPRSISATAASLVLLVAGCSTLPAVAPGADSDTLRPTVLPADTSVATPLPTPIIGGVDGSRRGPELTIEQVRDGVIQATLDDPGAKAWRIVVAGTGERIGDRWEIEVETGDVGPLVTATEVVDGEVLDVMDLSGFADGTASAGGCHSRLPVCLGSDGFLLPDEDGRLSVQLQLPEADTPLVVRGATASWEEEPFVLGPWHETDPFPWGEG